MNPEFLQLIMQLLMGGLPPQDQGQQMLPPQLAMPPQDPASNPDLSLAAGRRIGM